MKNPADIILELESDNSRLFKESVIIREMENGNDEFFTGVKLACDKLITFGVNEKTIPVQSVGEKDIILFPEFVDVLNRLAERKVTGNAAKQLLEYVCANTSVFTWEKWYRRILLKDLKCGVSETTVNNCTKKIKNTKYAIPVFSCQLAQDSNDHQAKMVGEKIIQSKLDGSRVLTILYPDGRVDQFSRNGKEILNFQHIKDQISKVAKSVNEPTVFDGEIMSASFQDLMTQFYRKENVNTSDSVLNLFDMIPLEDFQKGVYKIKQINRLEALNSWFSVFGSIMDNVNVLGYEVLDLNDYHGRERFKAINKKALDEGYEGIMIKDPNAPYECKRSTSWLKLKPFFDCDLEVIDVIEGTGKYEDMMGALICFGTQDNKQIKVSVGSGFSDEQRKIFWENRNDIIGCIVTIFYDVITKKSTETTYSLRFPRFKCLRSPLGEKGIKI